MKTKTLAQKIRNTEKKAAIRTAQNMTVRRKIWLLFLLFTAIVFLLIWFLEVVFLQTFYPVMKKNQTVRVAAKVEGLCNVGEDENIDTDKLQQIGINNNTCIEYIDADGAEEVRVDVMNGNCLLHGNRVDIYILLDKLMSSKNGKILMQVYDEKVQSQVIVYGRIIGTKSKPKGYLLMDAPLAPVGTFVSIIKRQMFYIIFILIVISILFSMYISNYISKPIKKLTESAESLARGDYNTKFEGGGYEEVDKLARTLEYAESELKKTDMMQRDLVANTSHDLRTPLTMIKAYAEMIRDLSGDNPEKRNAHLKVIIDESDRLSDLVNDMLDLSKLESGTLKLEETEFNITQKMKDIYKRYQLFADKKNFHIFFEPPKDRLVVCDEAKIERVICNLINNAVNYTAKDRNVYLREILKEDCVLIEVEDTGDGIEKDKIKLIFDKYYRSENHKRETVGTGLGLNIVKTILEMHGYRYGVRSTVGKGSVFWFEINIKKM